MVPELIGKYIFLVQLFVEAGERGLSWREDATNAEYQPVQNRLGRKCCR